MGQRSCPGEAFQVLLEQFELILDHHELIDEVGFIHPSQFAELNEDSSVSWSPPSNIWQLLDESHGRDATGLTCLQNEKTVLWYGNSKLAISMQVVPVLYNAALLAHKDARRSYKRSINIPNCKILLNTATYEPQFPEKDMLKHSRALLILSPDFGSAWNSRKLVLSMEPDLSLLIEELNLSALILSYSPKSEQAWSHRRWVIKKIAEKFHDLHDIIGKESEFVKGIAELFEELDKSRKWAELHVADNCCFHYRRRLILNLLEEKLLKDDEEKSSFNKCRLVDLIKDELKWNVLLIKQYKGREALWIHRRHLSYYWINCVHKVEQEMIPTSDCFLGEEIELVNSCLKIPADEFEDARSQARHAATYMLWISKKIIVSPEIREKLKEVGDLKAMLINTSPEKSLIWESLLEEPPAGSEKCMMFGDA